MKMTYKPQSIKKFVKSPKYFYLKILSRHPSINNLRRAIKVPKNCLYRHGSVTENNTIKLQINSIESVKNSSSKFLMKNLFLEHNVCSPEYFFYKNNNLYLQLKNKKEKLIPKEEINFPLVAKLNFSSRGRGMVLLKDLKEYNDFIKTKFRIGYYFEKYYNYNREYRLHITKDGCFYACRKMLKSDIPITNRWYRNDLNCVWITQYTQIKSKNKFIKFSSELNPEFDQPINWNNIVEECIKALKAVKLDIGAIDLRVQSSKNIKNNQLLFNIIEINSAPSMGDITLLKYKETLEKLVLNDN